MEKTYFIESKSDYLLFIEAWKDFIKKGGNPSSSNMMFYNIIRSKPFDNGFSPVKKKSKLDNGAKPWKCLIEAAYDISVASRYKPSYYKLFEPFKNLIGSDLGKPLVEKAWALIEKDLRLK